MRILGIDLGRKRIGVALGDTENQVVVGLPTLANDSETFAKLKEIIDRENIGKLIIGWPKTMSGQNGKQTNFTGRWGEQANKILQIEVEYSDERLSSKMARDSLMEVKKDLTKEDIDQAAAVLILQGYLDRAQNSI